MQLSIIIPTKERDDIFNKTLLAAANAVRHLQAEIIVVNDSKISTPVIPAGAKNIKLINNPKTGVASARNSGAKNSNGNLLLFLDNDIVISKDSIDHVIALHNQHEMACFNVDWIYPLALRALLMKSSFGRFALTNGMTSFKGWYNDSSWQDNTLFISSSVASFHLSISKRNFDRAGGYDEQFPHAGFEDYDFPKRLKKAGLDFYIDSRIQVLHNEEDRINIDNWLSNQQRRAETRRIAVEMGYKELSIHYSPWKIIILRGINLVYPLWLAGLKIFSLSRAFDPLYRKGVSILIAARIFKGYYLRKS